MRAGCSRRGTTGLPKGIRHRICERLDYSCASWGVRWRPHRQEGIKLDNRYGLVGWSEDQWNRVRQVVSEEAHKARVAASFLPPYGPLLPGTEVVPSELFDPATGRVNDTFTAPLVEIYERVPLRRQQV